MGAVQRCFQTAGVMFAIALVATVALGGELGRRLRTRD